MTRALPEFCDWGRCDGFGWSGRPIIKEELMERETEKRMPSADVHNAYSWLAVGVAVGSGLGVATGHIPVGIGAGLVLGALGAILAKRGSSDKADEE